MTNENARSTQRRYQIGFIGVGNMGAAILRGVCQQLFPPEQIAITDVYRPKIDQLCQQLGVQSTSDIRSLVQESRTVLCAVKPNNIPDILPEISMVIQPDQLLVSIAAGISTRILESYLAEKIPVVRVMPNLPASVGQGVAALSVGQAATHCHLETAEAIFSAVGTSIVVDEKQMDAVTGLSGSGPAFVFLFVEALTDAGVHVGLARPDAHQLAVQTVLGASQMLAQSDIHPAVLKGQVTTPAGTTATGLFELEQGRFRSLIVSAITAATQRSAELADSVALDLPKLDK